ncbi:MAG: tRNA lysidine(34) synthetase TilS, partial [Bacteroidales bacterium]|nr:tRNA lysidine(34) synthetase TilS [Bacteroidales bacterium]
FSVEVVRAESLPSFKTPGISAIDADCLHFPFVVRRPAPGDWFQPLGLRGRKKLSDLFVDLKYSLPDKDAALVVVPRGGGSHIIALAGVRIDEKYKVKDTTENCIKITLR